MLEKNSDKNIENIGESYQVSYDEALCQIKEEIRLSRDYVKPKREEFRTRLKLYNNQRKQKDKIGDTSIFNIMTTLLAIYYSDEMQVSFQGREIGDTSMAVNIENTAKFDYDEMEMDIINYQVQWDRLFFGVGIRQCSEWDNITNTPIPRHLSAITWLPDPKGGADVKGYRWHGFEVEYSRSELTEEAGFFNIDKLPKGKGDNGNENDLTKTAYLEAQNLNQTDYKNTKNKDSEVYDMVDIFTNLKGNDGITRKYLVTVDDECKTIFRCEEIEPVTKKEKEDPSKVPFPISLNHYAPQKEDPFGVSIPDLVEDKQRAKSIFKNLRIAAEKARIYPMYIYNRDKILNKRDLDFAFNKFIAVRGDVGNDVVMPINKANSSVSDTINVEQSLDADIEISTGSSKNSQGVMSEQQRTLGEQEIVQANANLRYSLGSKINAWGERRFWRLWYRLYQQNLHSEKIIRIQSAIGSQFSKITRKIFITNQDPDIQIQSKLDTEQKRNRDRMAFSAIAPLFFNDPTIPLSSKNFSKRHLLRLNGLPAEMIAIMVPDTPDEYKAKMENELLSKNNSEPEALIEEDHLSHIVVHSQAERTPATMAHIQAHYQLYYQSEQFQKDKALNEAVMLNGGNQNANALANVNANANANLDLKNSKSAGVMPPASNNL